MKDGLCLNDDAGAMPVRVIYMRNVDDTFAVKYPKQLTSSPITFYLPLHTFCQLIRLFT